MGYTNAGKSTLLNTLASSGVIAENKLFSTLDPVTRKIPLKNGKEILLTDTVGFIQKLPTSLVAAFRATLEEAEEAEEARSYYSQIFEVDISYRDVAQKMEGFK